MAETAQQGRQGHLAKMVQMEGMVPWVSVQAYAYPAVT